MLKGDAIVHWIELTDRHSITVDRILAQRTYMGVTEGIPNDRFNERIINSIENTCKNVFHFTRCVILPPAVRSFELNGKTGRALPSSAIAALFRSVQTVRDHDKTYSLLAVLWFQDSFDPLISSEAMDGIQKLDWVNLAEDVDD
jgi:hypothetical protein